MAKIQWGLSPEVVRTIYVAVIEPVLLYASSVWASAAKKISVQRRLLSVQRGFAQKIAKSYRTVSLNAALVLAGLLPLDLKIWEAARLYEHKRGRPTPEQETKQLEGRMSFWQAPHPAREPEIGFKCLENMETDTVARLQLPDHLIFTDGSKIDGEVGAAYTYWQRGAEIQIGQMRLESFCTVFQAELLAIHEATEMILRSEMDNVAVLSDSRSSLDLICNPDALHPLAFAIRKNLAELTGRGCYTRLFWVRAHVGIPGNERADELARQAAVRKEVAITYNKCPMSCLKREIRMKVVQQWNQRYIDGTTAGVTKLFFPDVYGAFRIARKLEITPVLVQILTGHGGFSAYLHKFKRKDSPSCICGLGNDETIQHLLLECQMHESARRDLETVTKTKLTEASLCELMANKVTRPRLIRFCIKVAKSAIARNKTR